MTGGPRVAGQQQNDRPHDTPRRRRAIIYVLLALPFTACLYPGWYNRIDPEFFGVPFFITYQMTFVFFGSAVMAMAYLLDRRARQPGRPPEQFDQPAKPNLTQR
jgi:Protein of unknown function (DUF3311)